MQETVLNTEVAQTPQAAVQTEAPGSEAGPRTGKQSKRTAVGSSQSGEAEEAGVWGSAPAKLITSTGFDRAAAEHRRFLLQIAIASTRNVFDAEDIVQEALMRGYRGLKNFRGDCPLRIWLARIVVRVSINHRRRFVRNMQRWIRFADAGPPEDGYTEYSRQFERPDPASVAPPREILIDVDRSMKRLPEAFRRPLLMLAVEGLTIPEIASILELPEGTVKSRIFYGRKRLKKSLKL